MENKKWKRFGSCLMALAMVLSGTALPASAATPGKDGSAEMNEAYAAHESLMPIGPSFSVACQAVDEPILEEIRKLPSGASMDQLKDRWYRGRDGSDYHYHPSRYHAFYAQKKVMLRIF